MSLPESMSRIVIVGAKSHIDDAIQVIYDVGSIHLIDHTVGADEGFSLGTSRPYSSKASERLLKVRAMEKGLGITPKVKSNPIPEAEIKSQISSDSVETVEAEVNAVFDRRNDLNQRITELSATKRNLEILSRLPIDLEMYSGYRSIFSMVGTVADDPSTDLVNADVEVFSSFDKKEGNVIAVFARNEVRDKVQSILAEHGFSEIVVPEGITGSPSAALTAIAREEEAATNELDSIGKQRLRDIQGLCSGSQQQGAAAARAVQLLLPRGAQPERGARDDRPRRRNQRRCGTPHRDHRAAEREPSEPCASGAARGRHHQRQDQHKGAHHPKKQELAKCSSPTFISNSFAFFCFAHFTQ